MAVLQNSRHEAFAQARARGRSLDNAYEDAGFVPGHRHGRRLSLRPHVILRIAEIRAAQEETRGADVPDVIAALLRLARVGEALQTPAGVKEARLAVLEAFRLNEDFARERDDERRQNDVWDEDEDEDEDLAEEDEEEIVEAAKAAPRIGYSNLLSTTSLSSPAPR